MLTMLGLVFWRLVTQAGHPGAHDETVSPAGRSRPNCMALVEDAGDEKAN